MEHKLILGGEQWLPFARSRIKALRAIGTEFAAQQFVMPDGAECQIRLDGQHEYIRISGGSLSIAMDAGLIDLKSVAPALDLRYSSGTRGETSSTQAYNTLFTAGATKGLWASYRSNPTQIPFHQIAGTIALPPIAGHLPTGAPSFRAKRKPVDPPTVPATWADDPADEALVVKKSMALDVPPSVFTGRMRLYVQALYGRPMYQYARETTITPQGSFQGAVSVANTAPPTLRLPAYKRPDDTQSYPAVDVDTSTGVYYHPATGKHWLVSIGAGAINFYPLISSATGEYMRRFLTGTKPDKVTPLDTSDLEKLEAFILAYCRPDTKNQISVACLYASSAFSLGYGWHWNWDGTRADAVTSTQFEQTAGNAGMESTHRRVSIDYVLTAPTPPETEAFFTWTASHTVVEGPTRWAVSRAFWCIAEPEWNSKQQIKSTPRLSTLFVCDAPFYAFYKRNELNTCRVSVTSVAATATQRILTLVGFEGGTSYGTVPPMYTAGFLNGSCEDVASINLHYKATFSIAGTTAADLVVGKSRVSAFYSITDKSLERDSIHATANDFYTDSSGTAYWNVGYGPPYTAAYAQQATTYPGWASTDTVQRIRFKRTAETRTASESSTATIIVPFNDAEAVFLEATRYLIDEKSGRNVRDGYSESLSRTRRYLGNPYTLPGTPYHEFLVAGDGMTLLSETTPGNTSVSVPTTVAKVMEGKPGTVQATMDDLSSYHDNSQEYASASYLSWSGVDVTTPVAFAPGHISTVGVVGAEPEFPALVGWV